MNDKKKTGAPLHGTPAVEAQRPPQEQEYYTAGLPPCQEKPSYWAVLPAKVRYDEELRPNAKLLYAEITALANTHGFSWISNERLGEFFGLSPKTIGSLIQQLSQKGYLMVELLRDEKKAITGRRIWVDKPRFAESDTPILKNEDTPLKIEDTPILKNEEKNNTSNINNPPYSPPKGDATDWKRERFEKFWSFYPAMGGRHGGRKPAKARALKAWNKLRPDDDTIRAMATALMRQKASDQWQDGVGIPYASTWLNGRMWEEDYEAPAAQAAGDRETVPREEVNIRWI